MVRSSVAPRSLAFDPALGLMALAPHSRMRPRSSNSSAFAQRSTHWIDPLDRPLLGLTLLEQLEQNDKPAVQRARDKTLETIAPLSNDAPRQPASGMTRTAGRQRPRRAPSRTPLNRTPPSSHDDPRTTAPKYPDQMGRSQRLPSTKRFIQRRDAGRPMSATENG
jgi:hypothetical protein